jgi:hypothetical protein
MEVGMHNLIQRVINLFKTPKTEWPVIASEQATIGSLYIPYVLVLAAIGPVATLLGGGGFGIFSFGAGFLLRMAIWQFVSSLLATALFALVINFLAPNFGAVKDQTQAFKTAVYASTAAWLGGAGGLFGWGLGSLLALVGAAYSVYLLYLALPHTMKAPVEKATSYTVVTIVVCIVIAILLSVLGRGFGSGGMGLGGLSGARNDVQAFDPDSPLGQLETMGKNLEKAEREGKLQDPTQAMGQVMGALAGAGAGATFEALPADTMKSFVPESLANLPRQSISAERNGAMGIQIANAHGNYGEGDHSLKLEITDTGGAAGFMAFAGWANIEKTSEEGSRTERIGRDGDRMVKEVWDSASNSGEYTVVVGNRFIVEVSGSAGGAADLKAAALSVDLARLESLKSEGVKPQ